MVYTSREKLNVFETNIELSDIPVDELINLIMKRPSNIIYVEHEGFLYGIITTGDIYREYKSGRITINREYQKVEENGVYHARDIFNRFSKVSQLPVVSNKMLVGEYSNWNDIPFLKTTSFFYNCGYWNYLLHDIGHVILVKPYCMFLTKIEVFNAWIDVLKDKGIKVDVAEWDKIAQYSDAIDRLLFIDEEELKGIKTCYQIGKLGDVAWNKAVTFKDFLTRKYEEAEDVQARNMAIHTFEQLRDKGVKIVTLQCEDNGSNYYTDLMEDIKAKYARFHRKPENKLYHEWWDSFFGEYYSEEYAEEITTTVYKQSYRDGVACLEDVHSKYYNVINGERITVGQPENYENTVYFFGPCFIVGWMAEDSHTIESTVQRRINELGIPIRVVNHGCWTDAFDEIKKIDSVHYKRGDIIVVFLKNMKFEGITSINVVDILEKNDVPAEWLVNVPLHTNFKVNRLIADELSAYLKENGFLFPCLSETPHENNIEQINIADSYINRYFMDFDPGEYSKIGAIAMNCNPFTKGHRYLIKYALNKVDYLIVFLRSEGEAFFAFEERWAAIVEGTGDLERVRVVPTGEWIVSPNTFSEYNVKQKKDMLSDYDDCTYDHERSVSSARSDALMFARSIAPMLNIKYRFVGEENNDNVTRDYNNAMKDILPQYGIEVIEIPRLKVNGKEISAKDVRRKMFEKDYQCVRNMLPDATLRMLVYENK